MKKPIGVVAMVAFAVGLWLLPAGASAQVVNGSFEDGGGSLNGWTVMLPGGGNPSATAVTSHAAFVPVGTTSDLCDMAGPSPFTYFPEDGSYFALLKTDGPGSETALSQTFSAEGGSVLTGAVFFDSGDGSFINDIGKVVIKSGNVVIATLFTESSANIGTGQTPWTGFVYHFPADGTYTLEASVFNGGDNICDSFLGLDAVQIVVIPIGAPALQWPVAAAVALMLAAVGMRRLRRLSE